MEKIGRLIVFEGVDGVGKTTLAKKVVDYLGSRGVECIYLAFPGHQPYTLGKHVYDLHHGLFDFDISRIHPVSLQMLHIAAHIDSIEKNIKPKLQEGVTVVLDRYWWSAKAYGAWAGIDEIILDKILAAELYMLDGIRPEVIFFIERLLYCVAATTS